MFIPVDFFLSLVFTFGTAERSIITDTKQTVYALSAGVVRLLDPTVHFIAAVCTTLNIFTVNLNLIKQSYFIAAILEWRTVIAVYPRRKHNSY